MVASGIPPHVTLASRMNTIEDKIDSIIDILNKHHDSTRHTQSKDERNAPATLSMMTDALAEMHARLVRDIVQQPISVGQLDSQNATTHEPQRLPLLQPLTKKLESSLLSVFTTCGIYGLLAAQTKVYLHFAT